MFLQKNVVLHYKFPEKNVVSRHKFPKKNVIQNTNLLISNKIT